MPAPSYSYSPLAAGLRKVTHFSTARRQLGYGIHARLLPAYSSVIQPYQEFSVPLDIITDSPGRHPFPARVLRSRDPFSLIPSVPFLPCGTPKLNFADRMRTQVRPLNNPIRRRRVNSFTSTHTRHAGQSLVASHAGLVSLSAAVDCSQMIAVPPQCASIFRLRVTQAPRAPRRKEFWY